MPTELDKRITRIIPVLRVRFKGEPRRIVVTLVPYHDVGPDARAGGIYLRGERMPESSSRFISWANAVWWAHRPDGRVARRLLKEERERNPDYPRVYLDTVRMLQMAFPDDWQRRLAVLQLRPPMNPIEPVGESTWFTEGVDEPCGDEGGEQPEAPDEYAPTWNKVREPEGSEP